MSGARMFVAGVLLSAVSVNAQVGAPAQPHTVSAVVDFWVTSVEQMVVPAAEVMPETKYSFAPSNGEFSGVRPSQSRSNTWWQRTTNEHQQH